MARALVARGPRAIDTDHGWGEAAPHGEWVGIEERARALPWAAGGVVLFVAGTASNRVQLCSQLDHRVLPSPI